MKKDQKKNKSKILLIKSQVYKARVNYQLPFYLTKLIYELDGSEDVIYIKFLMEMSKHCLRVSKYYKQYPQAEKDAENIIKDGLMKLGYQLDVHA